MKKKISSHDTPILIFWNDLDTIIWHPELTKKVTLAQVYSALSDLWGDDNPVVLKSEDKTLSTRIFMRRG